MLGLYEKIIEVNKMINELKTWVPNEKATIVFEGHEYFYNDIISGVEKISYQVLAKVSRACNIGIYLERSPHIIFTMLALLSTGNVYVPIDISLPEERVNYIVENADIEYVVTTSKYENKFKNRKVILIDEIEVQNSTVSICYEKSKSAYILYTSGTTGNPKGVEITKEALFNFIEGVSEVISFEAESSIACFTSVSFDIFFLESIMALYKGLKVYFANVDEQNNPFLITKMLQNKSIDMVQFTPSRLYQICNCDDMLRCFANVKVIMVGGEKLPVSLLNKLQEKTDAKIYNMYGPTEATIWSSIGDMTNSQEVHVGFPILNTKVYIVDDNFRVLPAGEIGELCISGKGLAKGYYNNEELTNEKFIILYKSDDERAYRTGDCAKISKDGIIEILGRIDNQVKIRGHRIELEEIENKLTQCESVQEAIVSAVDIDEDGNKTLVAFCKRNHLDESVDDIKTKLLDKLPEYMIPNVFYFIESFPLTNNGKVDRKKVLIDYLHNINNQKSDENSSDKDVSEVEYKVIKIIENNIDTSVCDKITLDSKLASIGVDSVTFVKVIVDIECEFDIEFLLEDDIKNMAGFRKVSEWVEFVQNRLNSIYSM